MNKYTLTFFIVKISFRLLCARSNMDSGRLFSENVLCLLWPSAKGKRCVVSRLLQTCASVFASRSLHNKHCRKISLSEPVWPALKNTPIVLKQISF